MSKPKLLDLLKSQYGTAYGTGENKLHIDSGLYAEGYVLFWVEGPDGDDVKGADSYISAVDAKGMIKQLSELFGLEQETETIKRWRDNQRVIEADNSKGLGVLPSNVVARIKADSFDEVLRLFKEEI